MDHRFHFSVSTLVIDDGCVLLAKREDLRVWSAPGGQVDYDETLEEAARRETLEETGIEAELTELHGIYLSGLAASPTLVFVYRARPVSGELTTSFESVDVRYFDLNALPPRVPAHVRRRLGQLDQSGGLYLETFSTWQRYLLRSFFAVRNLRNRYLLRRPPGNKTWFAAEFRAVVAGEVVASQKAVPGEVPWLALQRAVGKQAQYVQRAVLDVEQRQAMIEVVFV